ncbi:MAG: SusC/RagA family TonB-linked outer membrane protein [Salinivenus sp.]
MHPDIMSGFRLSLALFLCAFVVAVPGVQAQETGAVTGTVVDEEGSPLPGANVTIPGSEQGTSADQSGRYVLGNLAPDQYTLRASFVGYLEQEESVTVQAGDTVEVEFVLPSDVNELDEMVVVGYGEQEREDLTGSVSSIDGDGLSKVQTSSVSQALQGRVSGVQVTPTSGEPGAGAQIRIRGVGTLNDTSPLYVVDGMLTNDISFLNSGDIESVEVLKDASATAIYGSRGANGVIIISTKSGDAGEGTTFNADVSHGWQEVMSPIDLTNAREYATLANELRENEGQSPAFDDPDALGTGTDWQDEVYRTAPTQDVQLSARGGTEDVTYNFSGNFLREDGVMEKSDYQRASFRANNTYQLTEAFELGHNLGFTYRTGTDDPGVVGSAYRADPTVAPRDEDGDFNDASARASAGNPAASVFYHRNSYSGRRFVGDLYGEYDFLDHFTFESSLGLDIDNQETRNFDPEFAVSSAQRNDESSISVNTTEETSWLWENTISYDQTIDDHSIDVVAGVTAQEFQNETLGGSRTNVIGEDESLWYLNAGEEDGQTNTNTAFDWSMLSGLIRTNYSYQDRYLLTASLRADGSSRFGEENRYGYFPSVALGWRASEEAFLEDVDVISELKLRGSWGQIGNDKINAYPSVASVATNLNAVFGQQESLAFGATLTELANPQIQWEETTQSNVGVNLGLFEDQLTAEVDYYNRTTSGILVQVPIPEYVGVDTQPFVNAAEVVNSGVEAEVSLSQSHGDFSYEVSLNGSTTNNEVQSLGSGKEEIFGGGLANEIAFTTKTEPGQPIGSFYGYKVNGIYQTQEEIDNSPSMPGVEPGDLNFADVDGDGDIDGDDRTYIGSPIPDVTYGLNLSASYKGVDVSATVNGQMGAQVFNAKKSERFGIENFEASYLDRWTGEGTSTSEPRIGNPGHNWFTASGWLVEDADYLKLRNVQVGYTLPESVSQSLNLDQFRVYANGTNLVTFTGYSGYTPEISGSSVISNSIDDGIYPIARSVTMGIDMTF